MFPSTVGCGQNDDSCVTGFGFDLHSKRKQQKRKPRPKIGSRTDPTPRIGLCQFGDGKFQWVLCVFPKWKFLFGKSKIADMSYKGLFLIFIVLGAASSLGAVIDFSDAMVFAMIFPNMIGLLILAPKVKEEVSKYLAAIKASEE